VNSDPSGTNVASSRWAETAVNVQRLGASSNGGEAPVHETASVFVATFAKSMGRFPDRAVAPNANVIGFRVATRTCAAATTESVSARVA
jgi:hypothetical protein